MPSRQDYTGTPANINGKPRDTNDPAEIFRIMAEMFGAGGDAIAAYDKPDTGSSGYVTLRVMPSTEDAPHFERGGFRRIGDVLYERGVTCPGYQSLDAHEHVAKAMAESLTRNGVDAFAQGRMD